MRITKYSHSCIRLERPEGGVLVIDPGIWTEPEATHGADAVLVTHWHADHADRDHLAALNTTVYGPADPGAGVAVAPGDRFEAAGFRVRAAGGRHAAVYGDAPALPNVGYLVDGACYHPGDSFHVPDLTEPIETLFVPLQASWMKISEAVDFVRAVRPGRAFAIHEGQLNDRGIAASSDWLTREAAHGYRYLAPGETA